MDHDCSGKFLKRPKSPEPLLEPNMMIAIPHWQFLLMAAGDVIVVVEICIALLIWALSNANWGG